MKRIAMAVALAAAGAWAQQGNPASGRVRAGYDLGVDRNLDRLPAPPSLAQPTREEILEQQRNGRIRDREVPDRIRAQYLSELDIPNPEQMRQVVNNPFRDRDRG